MRLKIRVSVVRFAPGYHENHCLLRSLPTWTPEQFGDRQARAQRQSSCASDDNQICTRADGRAVSREGVRRDRFWPARRCGGILRREVIMPAGRRGVTAAVVALGRDVDRLRRRGSGGRDVADCANPAAAARSAPGGHPCRPPQTLKSGGVGQENKTFEIMSAEEDGQGGGRR